MKKTVLPLLFCTVSPLLGLVSDMRAQSLALIANGSFEANPSGTARTGQPGTGDVVDTTTFTNFRFYNVATGSGLSFTAQVLNTNPEIGVNALRLDINNPNAVAIGNYGFDTETNHIAVVPNTTYELSFDAAYIGGGNLFTSIIAQYSGANFTGTQTLTNQTLLAGTTAVPDNSLPQLYGDDHNGSDDEQCQPLVRARFRPSGRRRGISRQHSVWDARAGARHGHDDGGCGGD